VIKSDIVVRYNTHNMEYKDHIKHYQADADFNNYFENNPIEEHNINRRYAYIFDWLKSFKPGSVIEIGSGGGYALKQIQKIETDYFPLDIPVKSLKQIKSISRLRIYPVSGDAYSLPFKNSSVKAVVLSEVLEHLQVPLIVMKEIGRVLANDGILILSVPYKEKITYQICVHCNRPTPTHAHFHSFDEKKMLELAKSANLNVVKKVKMSNKLLSRISIFLKLNHAPFFFWKVLDNILNVFIPKSSHIIFLIKKM